MAFVGGCTINLFMSQVKPNLNDFLNSRKFSKKEKRSLSRNGSESALDRMRTSGLKKTSQQNAEQTYIKRTKLNYDDEDTYYEQREQRYPLKKVRSIESSQEVFGSKHRGKDWRGDSDEQEYEESYHSRSQHNASSAENFQSSRRQAKQFVESLARRINIEIGNINNTIDEFNRNLKRTIDVEYSKLRAAIKNAVEEVFESEEDNIKKLAKMEQRSVNQQLAEVRSQLQTMYGKLQKYKEGLDGQNWKRITGEILASDIESNVNELIRRSQKMKMLRSVKMMLDNKKEEAFASALEELLQVNLVGAGEYNSGIAVN